MERDVTDRIPQKDRHSIYGGLLAYNRSHLGVVLPRELGVCRKVFLDSFDFQAPALNADYRRYLGAVPSKTKEKGEART